MVMKVLTVIFALAASTVQADNCMTLSTGKMRLKTVLTNLHCTKAATDHMTCIACCENVPNTCHAAAAGSTGSDCTGDFYKDDAKDLVAVDATKSNFQANCCTAKKMCDITCPAGFTDKTGKATIKCSDETCSTSTCCDLTAGTCSALMASGAASCSADKHFANGATTATTATYEANCCVAKKMCDITCPVGKKDKTGKATIKCNRVTCIATECCDNDASKCKGLVAETCDANKYANPATAGSAATSATYKTACCIAMGACTAFSAETVQAASLAKTTQAPTVAFLLLTFGGALAFGQ